MLEELQRRRNGDNETETGFRREPSTGPAEGRGMSSNGPGPSHGAHPVPFASNGQTGGPEQDVGRKRPPPPPPHKAGIANWSEDDDSCDGIIVRKVPAGTQRRVVAILSQEDGMEQEEEYQGGGLEGNAGDGSGTWRGILEVARGGGPPEIRGGGSSGTARAPRRRQKELKRSHPAEQEEGASLDWHPGHGHVSTRTVNGEGDMHLVSFWSQPQSIGHIKPRL